MDEGLMSLRLAANCTPVWNDSTIWYQ